MLVPFALLAFAALPQQQSFENPCANGYTENVWDPRFTPGQQWSYRNRLSDPGSTFVVTKIDDVPGIGIVLHIDVLNVDLDDAPNRVRPGNNYERISIAIRRDALDASALQILKIVQTVGVSLYQTWKKNCGGLTYASTVADSIQTEQDAYLARLRSSAVTLDALQTSSSNLAEPNIDNLVSAWHTDADLGRPIEVVTDVSKSRKLGFLDYQPTDDSFLDLFTRLRESRIIP